MLARNPFGAQPIAVAGLYGQRIYAATYRRGRDTSGRPAHVLRCPDVDVPPRQADEELASAEAQRENIEAHLRRYTAFGLFSDKELRTMQSLWRDQEPIRTIAKREGVSRQAILARIEGTRAPNGNRWGGVLKKAPEFAAEWPLIKRLERQW